MHNASRSKKQHFWHLQLNIVTRKHRCIVHFSNSVIDVGLIVRMGVAGWTGGTTDICPARQKPSRRHWNLDNFNVHQSCGNNLV